MARSRENDLPELAYLHHQGKAQAKATRSQFVNELPAIPLALVLPAMNSKTRSLALFPAPDDRLAHDVRLTLDLMDSRGASARGVLTATLDLSAFRRELSKFDFMSPKPLADVMNWTLTQLERGAVQITHPAYFGLFNPNPAFPAQCADQIAGAFNPQLASSKTSPVAVDIESHVIAQLVQRAGLPPEATGHFTSGGSEANRTALVCALTAADKRFATRGARAFEGAPAFYVSRDSHLAWIKIAHETGIGREAVRLIVTDGAGRMNVGALRKAIAEDRKSGMIPMMIVATAGTTGAGMIDPLAECAKAARDYGLWYHVDAAWGGALIVSDRLSGILAGLELADSITIDAHKWLAVTMGCGMFFTRHPACLREAFDVSTSYMPSHIPSVDPYVTTAQWSRQFLGLRLFLNLAAAGWSGYAEHIEQSIELAAYAKKSLQGRGWNVLNNSPLAVLSLTPPGEADVDAIANRILASGRVWVSVATFEGRKVIRACVTNGKSSIEDIDELVSALDEAINGEPETSAA